MNETMKVLPRRFYGDPVDVVDELRRISELAKKHAERDRLHKSRRIRVLVKQAMKGK
jgi:hypothetical protein